MQSIAFFDQSFVAIKLERANPDLNKFQKLYVRYIVSYVDAISRQEGWSPRRRCHSNQHVGVNEFTMRETFFILTNASGIETFTLGNQELNEFGKYNSESLALAAWNRLLGGWEVV